MDVGTRRALFLVFAGLALAGVALAAIAVGLSLANIEVWLYVSLGLVALAIVLEIVFLFVGRPRAPDPTEETYDFAIEDDAGAGQGMR